MPTIRTAITLVLTSVHIESLLMGSPSLRVLLLLDGCSSSMTNLDVGPVRKFSNISLISPQSGYQRFKPTIEAAGATVVDRSAVITTHLGEVLVSHSADLFDRQQMNDLIDIVKESQPSIIDDIAAADIPMPTIQWIFRDLLQSQVPIKDSTRILEVISASYLPRPEAIVEEVRLALGQPSPKQTW